MVNYDLLLAVIFYGLVMLFFYIKRKNVEVQAKIFFLYRTKLGLRAMDKIAKLFPKSLHFLGYVGIILGFIGMFGLLFWLIYQTVLLFVKPETPAALAPVLPGVKIPGLPVLPFWYFIISIFVVAAFHEFFHGVYARLYNIYVKSSGFAFIGPIPAAFVEPDEKQTAKKSKNKQMAIFAAGPFANIVLFGVVFLLTIFLINPFLGSLFESKGIQVYDLEDTFPFSNANISRGEVILSIDGIKINDTVEFVDFMKNTKPRQELLVETDKQVVSVKTVKHPKGEGHGYVGVVIAPAEVGLKEETVDRYGNALPWVFLWFGRLFLWVYILSLGIGLFNLLPLGPIDGGRMFYTACLWFFKDEKKAKSLWFKISILCLFIIIVQLLAFTFQFFS